MFTTLLDLLAVICLAVFAWFIWPPLPLLVVGVAALAISRQRTARARAPR